MAGPAGQVTRQRLVRFFNDADGDKNGYLTMKELKTALQKQGYKMSSKNLKKQFQRFDLDGDNKVSQDEFMACMGEMPSNVHQTAMIRKMFVAFDKNGDGKIDRTELEEVFREMRQKHVSSRDIEKIMRMVDKDNSGSIDYDEFVEYFTKKYAHAADNSM